MRATVIASCLALSACASWFAMQPTQSGIEQARCIAEAGTYEQAKACECDVRERYAEAGDTPCDGGAP